MEEAVTAYVGIGSNLGDPAAQVRRAFDELDTTPGCRVTAHSHLYKSVPLGPTDQPDYVNAVARVATRLAPDVLLESLQAIEARHGRVRGGVRWGPRPLDLDLLLYGSLVQNDPGLTLPHPGLPVRAFVLYPLADIEPGLDIPGHGRVRDLRERCGSQRIERLESEPHG